MILRLERCGMKFAHIGDLHIGKRVHDFSYAGGSEVYYGSDDENLCRNRKWMEF